MAQFFAGDGCGGGGNAIKNVLSRTGLAPGQTQQPEMPPPEVLNNLNWDNEYLTFRQQPPVVQPVTALPHTSQPWAAEWQSPATTTTTTDSSSSTTIPQQQQQPPPMMHMPPPAMMGMMAPPPPPVAVHNQHFYAQPPQPFDQPQCEVFGGNQTYEEKKEQSGFFSFLEKVEQGDIRLEGKQIFEKDELGNFPEALAEELAEQEKYNDDIFTKLVQQGGGPYAHEAMQGGEMLGDSFAHWNPFSEEAFQMAKQEEKLSAEDWIKQYAQKENSYSSLSDPFSEGVALLEAGSLSAAILCFEAAVKKDPQHEAAWLLLGKSQAENEKDWIALQALERCLDINPNNLDALMISAVSYTNENLHTNALTTLKQWINKKYPQILQEMEGQVLPERENPMEVFLFDASKHAEALQGFKMAVQKYPEDVDTWMGLGVVNHIARDYEDAVAAFQTALKINPNNARLWNKIGATLANSKHNEEAIAAYNRALELNPGLVRAQYNLGIAYSNLKNDHEAATHFLRALGMQQSANKAESMRSSEMWDVLRHTFANMGRQDLVEKTCQNDVDVFRDEFNLLI